MKSAICVKVDPELSHLLLNECSTVECSHQFSRRKTLAEKSFCKHGMSRRKVVIIMASPTVSYQNLVYTLLVNQKLCNIIQF